jgi:hypothetical protein
VRRRLIFKYLPLTPTLPMNLDFNGTQPVLVYGLHSQLVVTTALILTFSPAEKGQRLQASLYAVVRRANPVAGAWWFKGGEGFVTSVKTRAVKSNIGPSPQPSPRLAGGGSRTHNTPLPEKNEVARASRLRNASFGLLLCHHFM